MKLAIGHDVFDVTHIEVVHHDRVFALPAGAARVGSVGNFDVFLVDPPPTQARPGDSIQLKLAMQAEQEVIVNYTVFVHLLDSSGHVAAQVDSWPAGGMWPTANWVRGQVVEDTYTLALPPDAAPGEYPIAIGMYDMLDGSRLSVINAQGGAAPDGRLILHTPIQVVAP